MVKDFLWKQVICLVLAWVVMATAWAAPSVVGKVRLGQHGEKTRVVLEVDTPVTPRIFTLSGPLRVVLDFKNTRFSQSMEDIKIPTASLVGKMRQGAFKPGVTRMVLDVKQNVKASLFTIPAKGSFGHRIVVDLFPRSQARGGDQGNTTSRLAPVVRPKPPRLKGQQFVIVIDPGHGGVDPGAVSMKKIYEKNVVLSVSKYLQKELQKIPNTKVHLTRNKDVFLKLDDRVKFAQRRHADLFISLHADAHKVRKVRGGSVYVLSEKASDKEAARLAREANRGDQFAGLDISHESREVQNILIDLSQRETMNQSALLAQSILQELTGVTRVRKRKVLFAGFRVLKAPEIPSVLIELAYLSNPEEERQLRRSSHQRALARAVASGVEKYLLKAR
jgi:N-acetylmuramoyl-L-alanine amidase